MFLKPFYKSTAGSWRESLPSVSFRFATNTFAHEVGLYGPSGWRWPIHFVIQMRLLRIRSVAVPQQWCAPKMVVGILLFYLFLSSLELSDTKVYEPQIQALL